MDQLVVKETYGTAIKRTYKKISQTGSFRMTGVENARWKSTRNFFCTVFLPHGFPESVSQDYLAYQLWDSIQAFASSITGGISTHAILKGVGVGDKSATTLAATMTWILKDGVSMVGRIVFSWFKGSNLDSDCKRWRLFADVLNDVAIFLDIISAYFKDHFFLVICLSGLLKSIVGVAGGATRAALTQHQARNNNMADVSAKDGSQETLVNLAALICNLILIPLVVHNHLLVWSLYILMTGVHLLANYFAVKSVTMEMFNRARFQIYMEQHLGSQMQEHFSIEEVNRKENVWLFPACKNAPIHIGVSFSDAIKWKNPDEIDDLLLLYHKSDYFLSLSNPPHEDINICICLRKNATSLVQLEAMYQAYILVQMHSSSYSRQQGFLWSEYTRSKEWYKNQGDGATNPLERFSKKLTEANFPKFKQNLEELGWTTSNVMFDANIWHVDW